MSQTSQTGQSGTPGRYNRSFGGLVGSMIVLVLVVLGIVVFRGAFRDTPDYEPDHIDYLELVTSVQQLGLKPVYPPSLPDGWYVKDASYLPGDRPAVDMVFTTADEHTAGIHQEDASDHGLIATYVGEAATEDDTKPLVTDLGSWHSWTDTDGDHAWTTEIGDDTVLVYSSGDADDLRDLVESLTTAKLDPSTVS
ncbi:DUF4245 family protein [Nocardioides mangrovi]|uniref:DUF4245 domain-containing protein n=1 Tax=Nocardioides mangrovi TaxID=2874580 RepID=A0ABS7UJX0_9ACTN|nr:DUF4245 family protein [Nocardioides mangrovi]MBZ5741323.1 DUF4245 domain-containing protein [Nocardioides mangrovi]